MASDDSWMLDEVAAVAGVRHVVVLSADGLVKVQTEHTHSDVADRLAATCSGLGSLGRSVSAEFGTGAFPRQVMVEFDGGFLFVRAAGDGSRLAVLTGSKIDPALLAQRMQVQILKLGERTFSTPTRVSSP